MGFNARFSCINRHIKYFPVNTCVHVYIQPNTRDVGIPQLKEEEEEERVRLLIHVLLVCTRRCKRLMIMRTVGQDDIYMYQLAALI